jgi:hypothetical protein
MKNLLLLGFLIFSSCFLFTQNNNLENSRANFMNLIKIDGKPALFSDLGARHAFAFNPAQREFNGFSGPYLLDSGNLCLSENISTLLLSNSHGLLFPQPFNDSDLLYLPGMMIYKYRIDSLEVKQNLIFIDNRSSMIKYEIKNSSCAAFDLSGSICGVINESLKCNFTNTDNKIEINITNTEKKFIIELLNADADIQIENNTAYKIRIKDTINLLPGENKVFFLKHTYFSDKSDELKYKPPKETNPENYYQKK